MFCFAGWFSVKDECSDSLTPWVSLKDIPLENDTTVLATKPFTCFMLNDLASVGEKVFINTDCSSGEMLELGDLYVERTVRTMPTCCITWLTGGKTTKETIEEVEYLLCQDSHSTDLLIPMFTKGCFYKVHGPKHSGGLCKDTVYRISDIIDHAALPCYVQLIHGISPRNVNLCTSIIKLEEICKEDTIIACSLHSPKFSLVEFPLDTDIEFIHTKNNMEVLNQTYVQDAIQYCLDQVTPYLVSLKVIQNFHPVKAKKKAKSSSNSTKRPVISGPILSDTALEKFRHQGEDLGGMIQSHWEKVADENQLNDDLSHEQTVPDLASQCTEDFTDEDSIQIGPECHYETIPCDKKRHKVKKEAHCKNEDFPDNDENIGLSSDSNSLEVLPRQRQHSEVIQESEYLVPVNLRKQSVYSNLPLPETSQTKTVQFNSSATCPTTPVSGNEGMDLKPSLLHHLPPIGHDRMDKFLQDSLEELTRSRQTSGVESLQESNIDGELGSHNPVQEEVEATGMKAKLDAFLDEIFDYDNLEKGKVSENLEHMVKLTEPNRDTGERDICFSSANILNKSVSASELYDKSLNPYSPEFLHLANDKLDDIDKEITSPSKSENNSASSRSASSIYRQMKCTHYGRPESYHTDSPYHRTDSGIVLSPRYSASEMGYNRDIYKAMSDVAWTPPDDLSTLSVEEVGLSLIYIGIKQKEVDQFMDQQIDGEQLIGIDDNLLKEAFPDLNSLERKKIVDFVHGWRPKKMTCY